MYSWDITIFGWKISRASRESPKFFDIRKHMLKSFCNKNLPWLLVVIFIEILNIYLFIPNIKYHNI